MTDIQHSDVQSIHPFAYVGEDPGAVGAYKGWVDTTTDPPYNFYIRSEDDTRWLIVDSQSNMLSVKDFGALGDGSHDDTAATQAAIDVAAQDDSPKTIYFPPAPSFYKFTGQPDLSGTEGIKFLGDGKYSNSKLIYSGTATSFIKAGGSHGFSMDGLVVRPSNALFTGDLVSLDHVSLLTVQTLFRNCYFTNQGAGLNARSALNMAGAIVGEVDNCTFYYNGSYGIIARAADNSKIYSNSVHIHNSFFEGNYATNINVGSSANWTIGSGLNVFEPRSSGAGYAIDDFALGDVGRAVASALNIVGNGFWDAISGRWLDLYPKSVNIEGNFINLGAAGTFLLTSGGYGVNLSSNYCDGGVAAKFIENAFANCEAFHDDRSNIVLGPIYRTGTSMVPADGQFGSIYAAGGTRFVGYTSSAAPPSVTQLPNSGDECIHTDTTGPTVYHAFNLGGVIKKGILS